MPLKRDWADMTAADFAGADPESWIAVLPVAAIEQHGPHLPVGTDALIAQAYLARARKMLPDTLDVTILPLTTLPHGFVRAPGAAVVTARNGLRYYNRIDRPLSDGTKVPQPRTSARSPRPAGRTDVRGWRSPVRTTSTNGVTWNSDSAFPPPRRREPNRPPPPLLPLTEIAIAILRKFVPTCSRTRARNRPCARPFHGCGVRRGCRRSLPGSPPESRCGSRGLRFASLSVPMSCGKPEPASFSGPTPPAFLSLRMVRWKTGSHTTSTRPLFLRRPPTRTETSAGLYRCAPPGRRTATSKSSRPTPCVKRYRRNSASRCSDEEPTRGCARDTSEN